MKPRSDEGSLNGALVAISLGSNLGDSRTLIENALRQLGGSGSGEETEVHPPVAGLQSAPLYRTAPVLQPGAPEQPVYFNTAAIGRTTLEPEELLALLKRLEQIAGRSRGARWTARPLDLDLLVYASRVEERPELTLPHPRLTHRAFYLVPLAEIAPGLAIPPAGRTVRELLHDLPKEEREAPERLEI